MTARRVFILLILGFLVIVGSLWLVSQRHLEHATLSGDVVLPGLEKSLNAVSEIRLSKADERTTLRRRASDWEVAERGYPADSGHVRKLLLDLAALTVIEEKTRNPQFYAQIGVEDTNSPKASSAAVAAVTPAKTFELIVGKQSGAKTGFVRVPHTPASLLAQPLIAVDADPRRWIDRAVVDVAEQQMKEAVIEPATGPSYTASRAAAQTTDYKVAPLPKGRELSSPGAGDGVGSALAALEADDVRHPPGAPVAAQPKADHAIFRTFNGLALDLAGHKEGEHHFIALAATGNGKDSQAEAERINSRFKDWQVEIPAYKYDAIFRPLEELLKKIEPPPGKAAKAEPQATKKSALPQQKPD